MNFYDRYIKRLLDIVLSGGALLVLWPVLLILAVLVRTKLGSPVIFCQERPGKNEKIFKLYKFRSMTDQRDADGNLLPDVELRNLYCFFAGTARLPKHRGCNWEEEML